MLQRRAGPGAGPRGGRVLRRVRGRRRREQRRLADAVVGTPGASRVMVILGRDTEGASPTAPATRTTPSPAPRARM
ncbi:MAG: hypothetical protein R3F43_11910 [bacterium]